jgi:predicted porin
MKKNWAAAAALGASLSAFAQTPPNVGSSVTLYGIIDVSARYHTGMTAGYVRADGDTQAVASGVGPTSRWGIRGSEDLGGGLRGLFNLESGINVDTGAQANAATYFDRASVVGLQGAWGTLLAGRQNTLVADSVGVVDPIGLRFAGLNPNIQVTSLTGHLLGIEVGATGSTGSSNRVNNSLKYSVPVGPVQLRAMYSAGEVAGSGSKNNSFGLGADWLRPEFAATVAVTRFRDANDRELEAANLGASWLVLPNLRIMGNLGYNEADTTATAETRNKVMVAGANYNVTPSVDLIAGFYRVDRSRTGQADDGYNRLITFLEYKLSRRSKVFLELDHTRWRGTYMSATGKTTSNGVALGVTHNF